MSQENAELVRRATRPTTGGPYAIPDYFDPQIEWGMPQHGTLGTYHGYDA